MNLPLDTSSRAPSQPRRRQNATRHGSAGSRTALRSRPRLAAAEKHRGFALCSLRTAGMSPRHARSAPGGRAMAGLPACCALDADILSDAQAADAIDNMNNAELFGRVLKVNVAKPSAATGGHRPVWESHADTYRDKTGEVREVGRASQSRELALCSESVPRLSAVSIVFLKHATYTPSESPLLLRFHHASASEDSRCRAERRGGRTHPPIVGLCGWCGV